MFTRRLEREAPSGASRVTLERRLRYSNRKARSAARRLGYSWVRVRMDTIELGSPCPFCARPRPVRDDLRRPCLNHECDRVMGSSFCPRESLERCDACGEVIPRTDPDCVFCKVKRERAAASEGVMPLE